MAVRNWVLKPPFIMYYLSFLLPEIESFFTHYASLNGKRLRIVRRSGPRRAHKLLKAGAKAFKATR